MKVKGITELKSKIVSTLLREFCGNPGGSNRIGITHVGWHIMENRKGVETIHTFIMNRRNVSDKYAIVIINDKIARIVKKKEFYSYYDILGYNLCNRYRTSGEKFVSHSYYVADGGHVK